MEKVKLLSLGVLLGVMLIAAMLACGGSSVAPGDQHFRVEAESARYTVPVTGSVRVTNVARSGAVFVASCGIDVERLQDGKWVHQQFYEEACIDPELVPAGHSVRRYFYLPATAEPGTYRIDFSNLQGANGRKVSLEERTSQPFEVVRP